ncbi:MAG: hypothetical protein M2R46_05039 [Verrucomicrobia subdivision 3 bacterium]|nr:hypothetical protein [Limisphaerales bacterium]
MNLIRQTIKALFGLNLIRCARFRAFLTSLPFFGKSTVVGTVIGALLLMPFGGVPVAQTATIEIYCAETGEYHSIPIPDEVADILDVMCFDLQCEDIDGFQNAVHTWENCDGRAIVRAGDKGDFIRVGYGVAAGAAIAGVLTGTAACSTSGPAFPACAAGVAITGAFAIGAAGLGALAALYSNYNDLADKRAACKMALKNALMNL